MKAILIDPWQCSVEYIDGPERLEDLRKLIGCDSIDICRPFKADRQTVGYVDDEGSFKGLPVFFVENFPWPIYGRAVFFKLGAGGSDEPIEMTIEQVHELVNFP